MIPLSCLFSSNGNHFVYLKESGKIDKRKVTTGEKNDKVVIITDGLKERDKILTSEPEDMKI